MSKSESPLSVTAQSDRVEPEVGAETVVEMMRIELTTSAVRLLEYALTDAVGQVQTLEGQVQRETTANVN